MNRYPLQFPPEPFLCLLGNGLYPAEPVLHQAVEKAAGIVCADGGAEIARRYDIQPDRIIGDLDSITPATRRYFSHRKTVINHLPSQNENDLEKILFHLRTHPVKNYMLFGFLGKRFDQTIATLQVVKKYRGPKFYLLSDDTECLCLPPGSYTFKTVAHQPLSLFGFQRAYGVTTRGLRYRLEGENLFEGSRGLSNYCRGSSIRISFLKGALLIIFLLEG